MAKDIEFSLGRYPVSPYVNSADRIALACLAECRPIRDAAEAERWISCLAGLPAKMKGAADALDLRAKAGVVLPRGIYEAFAGELASVSIEGGSARAVLLDKAAAAVGAPAIPAWHLVA